MANTNPSDMTDEELDKALEESGTPEPESPEPEEPETPEEEQEEEEEPQVEEEEEEQPAPEEETPEPETPPSRREQLRIQQLLAKLKNPPEKTEKPTPAVPDALDYGTALEADPEVIKKLEEDRNATNQAMYEKGLQEARNLQFLTRLDIDAPRVEAKYPQLDKSSDKFVPAVADAVNTMYLSAVGYDPETKSVQSSDLRYAQYVEGLFELAERIASTKVQEQAKAVVKQRSNMGLRPGGSPSRKLNLNKSPGQMSDDELDAVIAQAIPTKN